MNRYETNKKNRFDLKVREGRIYKNPSSCSFCGYQADCLAGFNFCCFDGEELARAKK